MDEIVFSGFLWSKRHFEKYPEGPGDGAVTEDNVDQINKGDKD